VNLFQQSPPAFHTATKKKQEKPTFAAAAVAAAAATAGAPNPELHLPSKQYRQWDTQQHLHQVT